MSHGHLEVVLWLINTLRADPHALFRVSVCVSVGCFSSNVLCDVPQDPDAVISAFMLACSRGHSGVARWLAEFMGGPFLAAHRDAFGLNLSAMMAHVWYSPGPSWRGLCGAVLAAGPCTASASVKSDGTKRSLVDLLTIESLPPVVDLLVSLASGRRCRFCLSPWGQPQAPPYFCEVRYDVVVM